MWRLFEPVYALTSLAPASLAAFQDAGLRGFWRAYFAGRAAPLGPVGAAPVIGAFFGFAPTMVARALPDVWTRISPDAALTARLAGARTALAPLLAPTDPDELAALTALMRAAAEQVTVAGRVLAAANAALPWPDDPAGVLWQAANILREHRGDGHVAALVTAGLDGAETCVWRTSLGGVSRVDFQSIRGWSDAEWTAATRRLRARGWLDDTDRPTATARDALGRIEATTDRLASPVWDALGGDAVDRAVAALTPVATRVAAHIAWQTPLGVPDQSAAGAS